MTTQDSLQPIELTTVTPIWTGGADGSADRLHATGIMGSLRWWYEVLVRGVGDYGDACDLGEHKCLYDSEKPDDGLCHACRVFGTTGWSRRFRLIVDDKTDPTRSQLWPKNSKIEGKQYLDKKGKPKTPFWQFKGPPRDGSLSLQVISTGPLYKYASDNLTRDGFIQPEIIDGLIEFMEEWGSIGAKPQMGFGLFKITSQKKGYLQLFEHLQKLPRINASISNPMLPALRTMFFTCIKVGSTRVEETFYLKSDLRRQLYFDQDLRHFVMGTIKGEHQGAKIMMSHPAQDKTIRIWGWIPENIEFDKPARTFVRNDLMKKIHTHLSKYPIIYWREFNSSRDTKHQYSDPIEFLESLMRGEK